MTAQIPDSATYRGESYSIAGKNGTGLFNPAQHGMRPVTRCTACWHGFVCSYSVDDQQLLLEQLDIGLNEPAPVLFGVQPKQLRRQVFDVVYEHLRYPVPYTGGLLLARDFIEELYVHMGFHPAWKYRNVHELVFRDGKLVQEADRSEQIAELRRGLADRPLEPGRPSEIRGWIEGCFSQEYRW